MTIEYDDREVGRCKRCDHVGVLNDQGLCESCELCDVEEEEVPWDDEDDNGISQR